MLNNHDKNEEIELVPASTNLKCARAISRRGICRIRGRGSLRHLSSLIHEHGGVDLAGEVGGVAVDDDPADGQILQVIHPIADSER